MSRPPAPVCTVIISARDRFSLTEECVENLRARTPEPHALIIVLGGASESLKERLQARYGDTSTLVFEPAFLNGCQARAIGLRLSKTPLTVCMDNDVFPRAGWLEPLLRCQRETGAGVVVPLMLETETAVHCAGSALFVTKKGGRSFARKVLPLHAFPVHEGTNLKRAPVDYGEVHIQLVDTAAALALGVNDERIQEGEEIDSGLTWKKAGRESWFEPESIVAFDFVVRLEDPGDIALFCWRWDIRNLIAGYRVLHEKWGMDMTELGEFKYFLLHVNGVVGWLPRLWHSETALRLDRAFAWLLSLAAVPGKVWKHLNAWFYGYYDWIEALEDDRPRTARLLDELKRSLPASWRGAARRVLSSREIRDGGRLEVFWMEDEIGRGPGASLFVRGEEVLRLACLGPGRGHYQVRPESLKRWDISRHYFKEETVDEQIDAAVRLLERETALDAATLASASRAAAAEMRARRQNA